MLVSAFKTLGLQEEDARLYRSLLEEGAATAGELAKRTGLVRTTLYNTLQRLTAAGVIKRSLRHGVRTFTAAPPRQIGELLARRQQEFAQQHQRFEEFLPTLESMAADHRASLPKFELFEGRDGVRNVFQEILNYRNITTYTIWPVRSMIAILSPEYLTWHNKERINNNVWLKSIWPPSQAINLKDSPFMGVGEAFKRHTYMGPPSLDATMGFWIYGDNVAFLSSLKESYGFVVRSSELVKTLHSLWKIVLEYSTPLKGDDEDTKDFFLL
ncbi:MAG: TrmB family transcriptional regulator [Holosporales bacterium]